MFKIIKKINFFLNSAARINLFKWPHIRYRCFQRFLVFTLLPMFFLSNINSKEEERINVHKLLEAPYGTLDGRFVKHELLNIIESFKYRRKSESGGKLYLDIAYQDKEKWTKPCRVIFSKTRVKRKNYTIEKLNKMSRLYGLGFTLNSLPVLDESKWFQRITGKMYSNKSDKINYIQISYKKNKEEFSFTAQFLDCSVLGIDELPGYPMIPTGKNSKD